MQARGGLLGIRDEYRTGGVTEEGRTLKDM